MNLQFTISEQAEFINVQLTGTTLGETFKGSLSGPVKYAILDGLLWYALNRMLDRFVATAVPKPTEPETDATRVGAALALYVHTTPFAETPDERQQRIINTISHRLPELAPLIGTGPDQAQRREAHAHLVQLAELIALRIEKPQTARHLLEPYIRAAA